MNAKAKHGGTPQGHLLKGRPPGAYYTCVYRTGLMPSGARACKKTDSLHSFVAVSADRNGADRSNSGG